MTDSELQRVLRLLAEAELDDEILHKRAASLAERVESHDRLNRLRADAMRLREELGMAKPPRRDRDRGVRLFPRRS